MATPLSRYGPQQSIDQMSKQLIVDESGIQQLAQQYAGQGGDAMAININSGYQQPSVQQNMASLEAAMLMQNAQQNPDQYGGNVANKLMQEKALRLEDEAQQSQSMQAEQQAMMQQQQVERDEEARRRAYVEAAMPIFAERFPGKSEEELFPMALGAAAQNLPIDKLFAKERDSFETLSPQEAAQMGLDPEGSYQREAGTGKVSAIGGGGVTVNTGDRMPPDMIQGPEGSWIPRPGSDTDYKRERDAQKDQLEQDLRDQKAATRQGGIDSSSRTVIQDLNRAMQYVPQVPQGDGVIGANARYLKSKVRGSPEWWVQDFIESAKSNIGIDVLRIMREGSPTGGALGQVPFQQQKRLEQIYGTLSIEMPPKMLQDNITRINNIYFDAIYGSKAERDLAVKQGKMTPEVSAQADAMQNKLSFSEFGLPKDEGAAAQAPPEAIEYLRQNPEAAADFERKYGYLPEGM